MRISLNIPSVYDGLVYIFDAKHNPPLMRAHSHREIEVALVLEGSLICRMGNRREKMGPGSISWLFSGLEHQLLERSQTCRMIVAAFKPEIMRKFAFGPAGWERLRKEKALVKTLKASDVAFLHSVTRHILDGYVDPQALNAGLGFGQDTRAGYQHINPALLNSGLHFLLIAFWEAFLRGREFEGVATLHPAVMKAIENLQDENNPIPLTELAKKCGSSFSQLSRLFHRQTGFKLNEYRNNLRLERFLSLYGDGTKVSITEACFDAGFGSYAQFFKVFTTAFQRSPRDYIRSSRISDK